MSTTSYTDTNNVVYTYTVPESGNTGTAFVDISPEATGDITFLSTFIVDSNTYTVTSIIADAFNNGSLTSVIIPNTITSIGARAFEFNGIYWHSELFRDKEYHSNKTKMSNNKNVQLIHIWEDDWIYRKDIVKSMIINKLHNTRNRIMSRKCEIREINDIDISRDFLNSNHIQGFVGSTSKIGLFYNNELVSLMTFKISVDGVYELNRFCNKINTIVAGGASRLFNYFLKKFECKKIISFSNNSYSNGSLYTKLGFVENKKLKPDYSYIIGDCRIHKFNFRNSNNDNNIKIYDCGKIKFEYNI